MASNVSLDNLTRSMRDRLPEAAIFQDGRQLTIPTTIPSAVPGGYGMEVKVPTVLRFDYCGNATWPRLPAWGALSVTAHRGSNVGFEQWAVRPRGPYLYLEPGDWIIQIFSPFASSGFDPEFVSVTVFDNASPAFVSQLGTATMPAVIQRFQFTVPLNLGATTDVVGLNEQSIGGGALFSAPTGAASIVGAMGLRLQWIMAQGSNGTVKIDLAGGSVDIQAIAALQGLFVPAGASTLFRADGLALCSPTFWNNSGAADTVINVVAGYYP